MHDIEVGENQYFETDAFFLPIRTILLKTLDDETSDAELKKLCLKLMVRMGLFTGNAETLIMAAQQ